MEQFTIWFAESKIAAFLRVYVAVFLANLLIEIQRTGSFDFSKWETWAITAFAAALPPFLRYLNPQDSLS